MKALAKQFLKFGVIGGMAFVIDYGLMVILKEVCGVNYLLAACISFSVSVVFNYICSMRYVFEGRDDISKQAEFITFLVLSIIGLGINELILWVVVDHMALENILPINADKVYLLAKLFATAIVTVWNFITRKIFLEKKS